MGDFKDLKNATEVENWLKKNHMTLTRDVTKYPSICVSFPSDFTKYIEKVKNAPHPQAKNAEIAKMMTDVLRTCHPVRAQILFITKPFINKALAYFAKDIDADHLVTHYEKQKKSPYVDTLEQKAVIDTYLTSVNNFRKSVVTGVYDLDESEKVEGAVRARLNVGGEAGTVLAMLSRMREMRKHIIGSSSDGAKHANEAWKALQVNFSQPIMVSWKDGILTERKSGGGGLLFEENNAQWVANASGNMLLLSTALMYFRQRDTIEDKALIDKIEKFIEGDAPTGVALTNWEVLRRANEESKRFQSVDGAGAAFINQHSNIDPLWLTFFTFTKLLKGKNQNEFYIYQRMIYHLTRVIRGNTNIKSLITSFINGGMFGAQALYNHLSDSTHIHLAPFILKPSRLYDIGACICPFDSSSPISTIDEPAISWRYFLGVSYGEKTGGIKFMTSMWLMEEMANAEETKDIRVSERILHQIIIGRVSPLANTNSVKGNALNVEIVTT